MQRVPTKKGAIRLTGGEVNLLDLGPLLEVDKHAIDGWIPLTSK